MRLTAELQLRTQQERIDILANNIANLNTTGFKASVVNLAEAFDAQEKTANLSLYGGIPNGAALGVGTGALYHGKRLDMSQGIVTSSDNPWDLAIEGQGFFQVMAPNGDIAYTRAGMFQLDKNGLLVNQKGDPLQPVVTIPLDTSEVRIKPNGDIVNMVKGEQVVLGQIKLVNFTNTDGLQQISNSLYLATTESGPPLIGVPGTGDLGEIKSGAIEQSNVDLLTAMTNLIQAQRAYQMDARQLQQGDEMWAQANALRR
ncbi:MAG: flagellar hook-basal body protein [Desulfitobacteriaceae bacterium]